MWKILAVFASALDGRDHGLSERLISAKGFVNPNVLPAGAPRFSHLRDAEAWRRTAGRRNPKKGLDKIGFPV